MLFRSARIIEEVDYRFEAQAQEACWNAYENDPDIAIPKVVMVSDRVLVSEWLEGTPLARIIADGSQAERNNAGIKLARFHFTAPMANTGGCTNGLFAPECSGARDPHKSRMIRALRVVNSRGAFPATVVTPKTSANFEATMIAKASSCPGSQSRITRGRCDIGNEPKRLSASVRKCSAGLTPQ